MNENLEIERDYKLYVFSYKKVPIYIGITKNIFTRMETHFGKTGHLHELVYKNVDSILYSKVSYSKEEALILERFFVLKYNPPFNTYLKTEKRQKPMFNIIIKWWYMPEYTLSKLKKKLCSSNYVYQ